MTLYKLEEFDSNYQDTFSGEDIKGYDVYSDVDDEKVGSVQNILVDESGYFRYLVVDTGFWVFGKHVLLPVGRSRIEQNQHRVYAVGFTKQQAEDLPEFTENLRVDADYEEQVRGVYRSQAVETAAPYTATATTDYDRSTYNYQQEPSLYEMNNQDHQTLKLYEERLVANKHRVKTGEVAISKHVETETQRVAVPVEKERVVIERMAPAEAGKPIAPGEANFREGEVAHIDIYEETPDIRKEAVLREEVRIRKEVEQDTVNAQETIRREELDLDTEGRPVINRND